MTKTPASIALSSVAGKGSGGPSLMVCKDRAGQPHRRLDKMRSPQAETASPKTVSHRMWAVTPPMNAPTPAPTTIVATVAQRPRRSTERCYEALLPTVAMNVTRGRSRTTRRPAVGRPVIRRSGLPGSGVMRRASWDTAGASWEAPELSCSGATIVVYGRGSDALAVVCPGRY